MSTLKKALYAAVGASEKAFDRAKSLPKRATEVPALVSKSASKLRDVPGRVRTVATERTRKASKVFDEFARRGERVLKDVTPKKTASKPARKPRATVENAPATETPAPAVIEVVG